MIETVRQALRDAGHGDTILAFAEGTRSAQDAARSIDCSVAQIAKSIVFRAGEEVVLVIASGAHRIDRGKVAALIGQPVKPADPEWVREKTGFAVGGVAPVGHACRVVTVIDRELLALDPLWAAAGSPMHVFRTTAEQLIAMTQGTVGEVKQDL
jgi:prolyl-tRNA editing enzyme YbaK/EbsC (Cys-tRNA(Pro) deacylase)